MRDIILLVLKDAHVMCTGVADKIQPYRIEIVVVGANLKTAYSYILENFHFYLSNLGITSNFCGALKFGQYFSINTIWKRSWKQERKSKRRSEIGNEIYHGNQRDYSENVRRIFK